MVGLFGVSKKVFALVVGGKSTASTGAGLGLSIVQELCAAEGFDSSIRSEPGRGTTVEVLFESCVVSGL